MSTKINCNKPWKKEDEDFVIQNYKNTSNQQLGELLNRTANSIRWKKEHLKLSTVVRKKWTEEEVTFLKENYGKLSVSIIAKQLNRNVPGVADKIFNLGLSQNNNKYCGPKIQLNKDGNEITAFYGVKNQSTSRTPAKNYIQYFETKTPEVAWTLGFLFADGCINKRKNRNRQGRVCLQINTKDFYEVNKTLMKVVAWNTYHRVSKKGYNQSSFEINNWNLYRFFNDGLEYKNKNFCFSTKIFDFLPQSLHRYFWRGYFDGDGCIGTQLYKDNINIRSTIAGNYLMDWSVLEGVCKSLDVNCYVIRGTNHIGRWSTFHTQTEKSTLNFIRYLYNDFQKDNIGLCRKFFKYVDYYEKKMKYLTSRNKTSDNFIM